MAATLIALEGAPSSDALVAALACERVDAEVVAIGHLPAAPGRSLLITLAAPGASEAALRRVVTFRSRAETPVGLIGCAPGGSHTDAERALALGFDDFVAGRASGRELALRLKALARRLDRPRTTEPRIAHGTIVVDRERHEVVLEGRRIPLTGMELDVLALLVEARGRAISRVELLDRAWGSDNLDVGLRAVDNLILRLRRKLGDPDLIVTVRGLGFRIA